MKRTRSITPYRAVLQSAKAFVQIVSSGFSRQRNDGFRIKAETASWETLAYGEGKSKPRVGGVGRPSKTEASPHNSFSKLH